MAAKKKPAAPKKAPTSATGHTRNLSANVLFKGKHYGPGENVDVPEDFPTQFDIDERIENAGRIAPLARSLGTTTSAEEEEQEDEEQGEDERQDEE